MVQNQDIIVDSLIGKHGRTAAIGSGVVIAVLGTAGLGFYCGVQSQGQNSQLTGVTPVEQVQKVGTAYTIPNGFGISDYAASEGLVASQANYDALAAMLHPANLTTDGFSLDSKTTIDGNQFPAKFGPLEGKVINLIDLNGDGDILGATYNPDEVLPQGFRQYTVPDIKLDYQKNY